MEIENVDVEIEIENVGDKMGTTQRTSTWRSVLPYTAVS